jgi:hypothetical protein
MMMAIRANTEVMMPKMIVPAESELDSRLIEAMVEFVVERDWRVEVMLSAGMFAVKDSVQTQHEDVIASLK